MVLQVRARKANVRTLQIRALSLQRTAEKRDHRSTPIDHAPKSCLPRAYLRSSRKGKCSRHLEKPQANKGGFGATRRIRTDDLLITNQLLYQLS